MAAFLITGRPGVGKTTLVRDVVKALAVPASGFYTVERRDAGGVRTGFDLVTLAGDTARLADIGIDGEMRVGRYGVEAGAVTELGIPAVRTGIENGQLVVIDEIGKMELLVAEFERLLMELFRSGSLLLATIMQASHPLTDEIKAQPESQLFELTADNRDEVRGLVEAQLRAATGQFSV